MADEWDAFLEQLIDEQPGWVTLTEASEAAGVSRSTLRAWYRTGAIPSRMVVRDHGPQRLVPLDAVVERALRSPRVRRQLDEARSLAQQVADLTERVATLERALGL
jgi:predicted site-specific integrase-resolvase